MAEQTHSADWTAEAPQFGRAAKPAPAGAQASVGMQALWRLAIWGTLATCALFTAVISSYSSATTSRPTPSIAPGQRASGVGSPVQLTLSQAAPNQTASGQVPLNQVPLNQVPSNQAASSQTTSAQTGSGEADAGQGATPVRASAGDSAARPDETAEQVKHLAEAVQALAVDQQQVLARIATLERNLDGVTGSIKRDPSAGSQPNPPSPAPKPPSAAMAVSRPDMAAAPAGRGSTPPAPIAAAPMPAGPMLEAAATPARAPAPQSSGAADAAPTALPDNGNRAAPLSPWCA